MTDEPNHSIDEPQDPAAEAAVESLPAPVAEPTPAEAPQPVELSEPQATERDAPRADAARAPTEEAKPHAEETGPSGETAPQATSPSGETAPQATGPSGETAPQATGETAAAEATGPSEDVSPQATEEAAPVAEAAPQAAGSAPVKKERKKAAKDKEKPEGPEKPAEPKSDKMDWYILKVQSNREDSIREGLLRRVAIAGLDTYFGEVIVPTEKVAEFKGGKKRVSKRKLYPGYLVVQMEINEDTWFLVRETPGIGDFTGAAGRPSPMLPQEVDRILAKKADKPDEAPKPKIGFHIGDRVKIVEGTFENFEGEVSAIDETNGRVTVMISIFNRSTPVEFEYWQIEAM